LYDNKKATNYQAKKQQSTSDGKTEQSSSNGSAQLRNKCVPPGRKCGTVSQRKQKTTMTVRKNNNNQSLMTASVWQHQASNATSNCDKMKKELAKANKQQLIINLQ